MPPEPRRLALIGGLYALVLVIPFVVDALSEQLGDALYLAGLCGLPVAALVVQVHAVRGALREAPSRLARPVMRVTLAFFGGATVVLFLVLVPLATILGTFDALEGTGLGGGVFFLAFAAVFAVVMLITAVAVIGVGAVIRKRRASSLPAAG